MAQSLSSNDVREHLMAKIAAIQAGTCAEPIKNTCISSPPALALEHVDYCVGSSKHCKPKGIRHIQKSDNEVDCAFRKIERLACVREQASKTLRRRLMRDGFSEQTTEQAIERALACGLVDDARYADVLVRSRLSQGRGRRGIEAELVELGIDPNEVTALGEDEGDDKYEVERALDVLMRKPPRSNNIRNAAYRRLAQKGFSASVASTAARLWCEQNDSL